jgi:uncharacterized repeat protein (TIGR03803 family)
MSPDAHPPTHVIYRFRGGSDGSGLYGSLVAENGALYGTTFGGGIGGSGYGNGTVFKMSSSGAKTILYAFQGGSDGANPQDGLNAGSGGILYGDTDYGGGSASCPAGCGVVYEMLPSGSGYSEKVIYAFAGGADGALPLSGLLVDHSGAIYGVTVDGGGSAACTDPSGVTGCGTAFKLTPSGSGFSESVLYRFQGGNDGAGPRGTLIEDGSGALYGTTLAGGGSSACTSPSGDSGCGTVFKLTPSSSGYSESILYSFQGGSDGWYPRAALVAGSGGALVGATLHGGTYGANNLGTIFKLTPSGSSYAKQTLFSFNGADGALPFDENGLIADGHGNLYGTTSVGGRVARGQCFCGVVFKLAPSGSGYSESVLYKFQGTRAHDGVQPRAALTMDSSGELYGVTTVGGLVKNGGYGTVFKLAP